MTKAEERDEIVEYIFHSDLLLHNEDGISNFLSQIGCVEKEEDGYKVEALSFNYDKYFGEGSMRINGINTLWNFDLAGIYDDDDLDERENWDIDFYKVKSSISNNLKQK